MDEWILFTPNVLDIYKIIIFDDGNEEKYHNKKFNNEWLIGGVWRGKIRLINRYDSTLIIKSISKWKIIKI
jgi:hypothetical protein